MFKCKKYHFNNMASAYGQQSVREMSDDER